jgi:hypothetical protein
MDVRRFAALEMSGNRGELRRRRIVVGEFVVCLLATLGIGGWLLATDRVLGDRIFAAWLVGVGLNYAPLTGYGLLLSRPGSMDAELAGVDRPAQRRRYAVLQFWVLVPLSLLVLTAVGALRRPVTPDPAAEGASEQAG